MILPNPGSNLDFFLKLKGKFVLLVATLVLNNKCPTFIALFLPSKTNEKSKVMFKCEYTNPKIESKLKTTAVLYVAKAGHCCTHTIHLVFTSTKFRVV